MQMERDNNSPIVKCIWKKIIYENCGNEIKWRMILAVMNAIYAIA